MKEKTTYKAEPNGFFYLITTALLGFAIAGYFLKFNDVIVILSTIFGVLRLFSYTTSLYLYKDRFVICQSNSFGSLTAKEVEYPYSSIKSFEVDINKWKIGQSILLTAINIILPGKQGTPLLDSPRADIRIEYLDDFDQIHETEIKFYYRGSEYETALKKIKQEIG